MAKKDLKRNSHKIHDDAWWYEENYGIEVYIKTHSHIEHVRIPWRSIRAALKRKDK